MPNRIIREAILSSERMARLNASEEVLFRRLMSVVDDYGRFEGNPQLIRSRCFPLQTDDVKQADVVKWLAGCRKSGVLQLYSVGGKEYLELFNFGQQIRAASKCPQPPAVDSRCEDTIGNAHLFVSVSESVSEVVSEVVCEKKRVPRNSLERPDDVSEQVWTDWVDLRKQKKTTVSETAVSKARKEAQKAGMSLDAFLSVWCLRGSQGLEASWLTSDERASETPYQRNRREFMTEHFPSIAAKPPMQKQTASEFFEMEAKNVAPRRLG